MKNSFPGTAVVQNLSQLAEVNALSLDDGTLCFVRDLQQFYVLNRGNGAAADGLTIIRSLVGNICWQTIESTTGTGPSGQFTSNGTTVAIQLAANAPYKGVAFLLVNDQGGAVTRNQYADYDASTGIMTMAANDAGNIWSYKVLI